MCLFERDEQGRDVAPIYDADKEISFVSRIILSVYIYIFFSPGLNCNFTLKFFAVKILISLDGHRWFIS